MTLKQEYLHQNGPFPFNFTSERVDVRNKITELMNAFHPNEWAMRGFQLLSYLDSFKQIYGFYSDQLTNIIIELLGYLKNPHLSCQANISILKTLVGLKQYKISLHETLKFDNKFFLNQLKQYVTYGTPFSLKNSDSYMQNLIKLIKAYSKYGQQCFEEIIELTIEERDIKYLAIFIKSIKSPTIAEEILKYIFEQSSIFDRDTSFFYIISELTLEFPSLDLSNFHQTLSQEIIKVITTIVDPATEEDIKKLTSEDPCIGVQCTLKSIAKILVNCLQPMSTPGWQKIWSCIQRIFSIIAGLIDHTHEVECMNDFLIFMKQFVKAFLNRYRKQRGMYKEVNQDFIEEYHSPPQQILVLGQEYLNLFGEIWMSLIPELLYLEDGQIKASKILADLAIQWPEKYLAFILQQIKAYLQKDITIYSTYTPKMTLLFLQQFVILKFPQQHQFTLLIECFQFLLDAAEKLGISENLDMLELVMRNYMYFSENMIEEKPILQSLTQDLIGAIQQNMDAMSINLQNAENEEAEVYTDFKNIYFNLIIRLNQKQISGMCDKLLYKIKTMVPDHRQAYEFLVVCLTFKDASFGKKILDFIYKQIVAQHPQNYSNGTQKTKPKSISTQIAEQALPNYINYSLTTKNEQHLKWYCSLIQCSFQYNPESVVSQWPKLEAIITLLLRQFDQPNLFDWGLDILFNIIINLQHIHLHPTQFYKDKNRKYKTMGDIKWIHPSATCIALLQSIKATFYTSIANFMEKRYGKILQNSPVAQRIRSEEKIQINFDKDNSAKFRPTSIKSSINQLLDCLLVPAAPSTEDIEERKNINKLLSIQYSVFSSLQMRSQFSANLQLPEMEPVFIKQLGHFRKHAISYLKWVLQLLGHYNCLYDQSTLKLFHFFWREAHDQLYFSAGIAATNQKLHPFFYPTSFKKKQLFQNPFLIMTECYITFMMRIQLFSFLYPIAYLNNPEYLEYIVPLCFTSYLDCSLKSYVPLNVDPHQSYHYQILNLSRIKLSQSHPNSYLRKFIGNSKAGSEGLNKNQKQKYLGAMRVIISNYKRSMGIFLYPCCVRDEISWYGIEQMLQVCQYLEKKVDKVTIIEVIYLLVVFSFDFKGNQIYKTQFRDIENNQIQLCEEDTVMLNKVVNYVRFLIDRLKTEMNKKYYEKDATVLGLLLMSFCEFIPLDHQIYQEIIPLSISLTSKDTEDMMNMGKSFLFRILNRFIKKKTRIEKIENTPVKRDYQDFRIFRHIGGRTQQPNNQPPTNLITSKTDNYYYPLSQLQYLYRVPLGNQLPNEALLLSIISSEQTLRMMFKSLLRDTELKNQQSEVDVSYLSQEQPKRIYSNGHKLINYILDNNPKKLDIYLSFIDNFSNYPICFYHRLFRKMLICGGAPTLHIFQKLAKEYIRSPQKQQVKLCQFLLAQILPFCFDDDQFYSFYTNFLVSCSKQEFDFANGCLMVTFCVDWKISKIIFNKIINRMRTQKGPSRLRHFEVFNNYLLCAGRFAQDQAKNGIQYLMGGIEEGSDEVSELIVSMLIYCFIIPINLSLLKTWVKQPMLELIDKCRIYKLDENTGYQINEWVRLIINEIVNKTTQQKDMQSKNLKIYSKITYKILSNITVFRFNDEFFRIFKDMMLYIVNKPLEQAGYDEEIVSQLKDSEYPQHIYDDLLKQLTTMEGNTINVVKKKLRYIESMVINKIYCSNQVNIPDIFSSINEKQVTIDHIVAASNMARILKGTELTNEVLKLLSTEQKNTKNLHFMMAYLLAAGTRDFEWRQKLLNNILSFKKYKIVKEFVSYWWKGRNPETQKQQRLCMLVRSVENPYSYFA